jgi:tRNA(Ile)-lysidine synthase TilS/MesJ
LAQQNTTCTFGVAQAFSRKYFQRSTFEEQSQELNNSSCFFIRSRHRQFIKDFLDDRFAGFSFASLRLRVEEFIFQAARQSFGGLHRSF